jgi:hypothetical protein
MFALARGCVLRRPSVGGLAATLTQQQQQQVHRRCVAATALQYTQHGEPLDVLKCETKRREKGKISHFSLFVSLSQESVC